MSSLFNYNCFETRLVPETKSLFVLLNERDLNLEFLFELESLLAWCTARVEIKTIVFKSTANEMLRGFTEETGSKFTEKKIKVIQSKLQKIVFAMNHLPQTVVMDIGTGANNIASEFLLGADIRIGRSGATVSFNHASLGLIPASGGMSFLSAIMGPQVARNWVLSGDKIKENELKSSGFIFKTYDETNREEVLSSLLESIASQCEVSRIQTKMALFENIRESVASKMDYDQTISNANFVTGDWKAPKESMKAKSASYAVKLSLVKNEDEASTIEH